MVVEIIRYEVQPSDREELIAAYRDASQELTASPHCLRFEILQGVEEPNNVIVRIEWDSVEGHEKGFRGSPEFRSFFGKVKPFFNEIREMKHYTIVSGGEGAAR